MTEIFPRTTSKEVSGARFLLDMEFLHKVEKIMCEKGWHPIDTEKVEDILLAAEKVLKEKQVNHSGDVEKVEKLDKDWKITLKTWL